MERFPLTCCLVLALLSASSSASAGQLEIISQPVTGGATGNQNSVNPDIDDSGDVIVFSSSANDLVSGDSGPLHDVFVYTRETRGLTNITLGADDNSGLPRLSPDGRYVAFVSNATNLSGPDDNGNSPNVFLLDRQTDSIRIGPEIQDNPLDHSDLASARARGARWVDISHDGELVAFATTASRFRPVGALPYEKLHLWNPTTGDIEGIALQAEFGVTDFDLSDDGRFVVFVSSARNVLNTPLEQARARLYLYDVAERSVELLLERRPPFQPTISADGRHVAFLSTASGTPEGESTSPGAGLYTLDTQTDELILVDSDFAGAEPVVNQDATLGTSHATISADGNRISFQSFQRYLVPGDNNGAADIFVWDRTSGQTLRLTPGADRISGRSAINGNGDSVVFSTAASNLLDLVDTNSAYDVLAWRASDIDEPDCEPTLSGVLASSSGVRVNLQGTSSCFGNGLYSYGTTDSAGLTIPAARGRPELQLVPQNESGLPDNDLIFFTYPAMNGERFYATSFVSRRDNYNVQMTFKASNPNTFELFELVVYEPGQLSRRQVVYREQETQWLFTPQGVDNVLNIVASLYVDGDDDNRRSGDESPLSNVNGTLFSCGGRDGIAGNARAGTDGQMTFTTLEPGFYQLAIDAPRAYRFSSPSFDNGGNLLNVIKSVVATDSGSVGYSACTDFSGGATEFGPIGLVPR